VTPAFEFLVEVIPQKICDQWQEKGALRSPFVPFDAPAIGHQPRLQEATDDREQALVADALGETGHRDVVLHSIEELLQVEIDDDAPSVGYILLSRT
jgi:hypothetical protein